MRTDAVTSINARTYFINIYIKFDIKGLLCRLVISPRLSISYLIE